MPVERLRSLAVLHPFPSFLNAALVSGLFLLARGGLADALLLGGGMLCLQFAIGAVNDVVDTQDDAAAKPHKPIAAGLIGRETALRLGVVLAGIGLAVYAVFGSLLLLLAVAMLACGLAYDLWLKRAGLGWLCFAAAFPLLPLSTWLAATGGMPPRAEILLPVAALAGPALQLSNGLADLERDRARGIPAPVVRLGAKRSVVVLGGLLGLVYGLAWISLAGGPTNGLALAALSVATALAIAGLALSASSSTALRERAWQAQAVGIAMLAGGWLTAVA
jgi:4-hydroxybenzoate polyprenyltransferase